MKNRIALIYGGEGREHDISLSTASGLYSLIDREEFEVLPIYISPSGEWFLRDTLSLNSGEGLPVFPVFFEGKSGFISKNGIIPCSGAIPALHGDYGEDGKIQGTLDTAHIPYIGADCFQGAVTNDKAQTKIIAEHLNIPTAKYIYSKPGESPEKTKARAEKELSYPMFVKPSSLGSSIGASAVYTEEELIPALIKAYGPCNRGKILIEELIPVSAEIECAFYKEKSPLLFAGGIIKSESGFYSYEEKYSGSSAAEVAHGNLLPPDIKAEAEDYALRLSEFLELRHLSRIDFFLSEDGKVYFNEINCFPGMTKTSLYPKMTEDMGMRRGEFINRLLRELCCDRNI